MASKVKKRRCEVVITENGRISVWRIRAMIVPAKNGKARKLRGRDLPDSMLLFADTPQSGARPAQALLNPKSAKTVPFEPDSNEWSFPRDVLMVVLGFFFCRLIEFLAEEAAFALSIG